MQKENEIITIILGIFSRKLRPSEKSGLILRSPPSLKKWRNDEGSDPAIYNKRHQHVYYTDIPLFVPVIKVKCHSPSSDHE